MPEHPLACDQAIYHIRVRGHLDRHWIECFENVTVAYDPNGETLLAGRLDQAALYGLLARLRDLGLILLSVTREEKRGDEDDK